jgi:rod shape-determining protein MreB
MAARDLAIDLGTVNIVVYVKGKGIVLEEPSVIAMNSKNGKIIAVGSEAKEMVGKTPANIHAIRPLRKGVIADYNVAQSMIKYFIKKVNKRLFFSHPKVVVTVPLGITEVEMKAVKEAVKEAGGKESILIDEVMAAAIGSGINVSEPTGNMVVDIGGGVTEVAIISLGGIVVQNSIRIAGDAMDEAIINYFRSKYNFLIGEKTAEKIKILIGNTHDSVDVPPEMVVIGRDLVNGLPSERKIKKEEVREAISEVVADISDIIRLTLENTPPEIMSDIMENGIMLTGGASMLNGFDKLIEESTQVKTILAEEPLKCVAKGAGILLENLNKYYSILKDEQ